MAARAMGELAARPAGRRPAASPGAQRQDVHALRPVWRGLAQDPDSVRSTRIAPRKVKPDPVIQINAPAVELARQHGAQAQASGPHAR